MKPRTIVYGLGKRFRQYFYEIHETYDVVGYCDADPEKVVMFRSGMTKAELASHPEQYDQILVTLADRQKSLAITAEFLIAYGIDPSKVLNFQVPSVSLHRESKDNIYHPEVVFYGNNNEDAVLWLLLREMRLDVKDLTYLETGLDDLRKGSVTYSLYRNGATGKLAIKKYDSLWDEVNIFRAEDVIFCNHSELYKALKKENHFDIVILYDEETARWFLDDGMIFTCNPQIILVKNVEQDVIAPIRYQGYVWYTTLSASIAVFCRAEKYLSVDSAGTRRER